MKHLVNTLHNFLLPLLTALFFVSCTLIDNDLRDLPDIPAYREIVHAEGEGWEADYQYQPWTKILDEGFMGYVADVDFDKYVLYLYDYIPDDVLPKVGDVLAAAPCEKIKWGLSHKVIGVKRDGNLYAVSLRQAKIKEVFKHIIYNQEAEYVIQFDEELAEENPATRGFYLEKTRGDNDDDPSHTDFESEEEQDQWAKDHKKKDPPYSNPNDPVWSHKHDTKPYQADIAGILADAIALYKFADLAKDKNRKGEFTKKKAAVLALLKAAAHAGLTFHGNTHNVYNLNFHNYTDEFGYSQGNLQAFKTKDAKGKETWTKLENVPKPLWYFNGQLSFDITFSPTVTTKNYINSEKNIFECVTYIGTEAKFFFALAAELGVNVNIFNPTLACVCIGAPIGLPLWFELSLSLDWYLAGKVNFSAEYTKVFGIKIGVEQDIDAVDPDRVNRRYVADYSNPDADLAINDSWSSSNNNYGEIKTGLVFSATPTLTLGFPEKSKVVSSSGGEGATTSMFFPNLQLQWKPSIAFEAKLGASDDASTVDDVGFHIGIPVSFTDVYLIANLTENFSPSKNIGHYFASFLGLESGNEIWKKDWKFNPTVENFTVICLNPLDKGEVPEFQFDFDITDIGLLGSGYQPSIRIYGLDEDEYSDPIILIDDFDPLTKRDIGKHFTRRIKYSDLKRDKAYTARVEFRNREGRFVSAKKTKFSEKSPCAYIDNMFNYAQFVRHQDAQNEWPYSPKGGHKPYFSWKFKLDMRLQSYENIEEWGFYIGDARTEKNKITVKGRPTSGKCWVKMQVSWGQEQERHFVLYPWVKDDKGNVYVWPNPYPISLDYCSTCNNRAFGGKDSQNRDIPYRKIDRLYYYGFEDSDETDDNQPSYELKEKYLK